MSTPLTVFLELQTVRHVPLVLRGGVIPAVALCTLERDVFLHCRAFLPSCFRAFVFLGKHTLTDDSSCLLPERASRAFQVSGSKFQVLSAGPGG